MPQGADSQFGPEEFAVRGSFSRETLVRLKIYASMLADWNARQNLVSRSSLEHVWLRHFWDSAQLAEFVPAEAESLVDLGSGAGFPGLVLAELLRDRDLRIALYESTQKKRDFLTAVADRLGLRVELRGVRIEDSQGERFDVITARACAPLPKLLGYAQRFWAPRTVALFLKGQNLGAELTEAHKYWKMNIQKHSSRSSPTGAVLEIRGLESVAPNRKSRRGNKNQISHPGDREPEGRRRKDHHRN
jgi:16S rRNA (guanine527-N7)-methyltransferase